MTTTTSWTLILSCVGILALLILMFIVAARKRRAAKLKSSNMGNESTNASREERPSKHRRRYTYKLQLPQTESDYRKLFLINEPSPARSQTYINRDAYERIKRFLPTIAPNVSISSYISNVLTEHLNRHWEEIVAMYDQERTKPL